MINMRTGAARVFPIGLLRLLVMVIIREAGEHDYDASNILHHYYDFIIVGAGTAGGVLASRLTEVGSWRVLLLESGGTPPPESHIPALNPLLMQSDADWNYVTTSQRHGLRGYKNNACPYPLGRGLGGGSTINWMMYVRGNRRDYNHWESLGNPGWGYNDILKYFKKAEDYRGTRNVHTAEYHGKGGPLKVEDKRWGPPLLQGFLNAGKSLGYDIIDANGPEQIGFSMADVTQNNARRGSVAESYIKPAAKRPNLHVATNAHVTQVLIDDNKRAIGVRFEQHGKVRTVMANREVILSAGAIGSPKILMLSGVGPAQHLQQHYIPVVLDLPGVGQNLHDHPSIFGLTWTSGKGTSSTLANLLNPIHIKDYIFNRQGPFTSPFGVEGNAWIMSDEEDPYWPDLQFLFVSGTPALDYGLLITDLIGFRREFFNDYFGSILGVDGFSIGPMLTRPKSRGSVTLRSNNPRDPPLIDPNFLSHPDDVKTFIRGIKFALSVGNSPALKKYGAKFHDKILPGCEHEVPGTDAYWDCYTRYTAQTTYHPTGTCKMGPASDHYSVVDHTLKVHGIAGLRVVDSSIMPQITCGNLNAPTIMIAEKTADVIKQEWDIPIYY